MRSHLPSKWQGGVPEGGARACLPEGSKAGPVPVAQPSPRCPLDVNLLLRGQSNALLFADAGGAARLEQDLEAALPGVDVHLLYRWDDAGGANSINSNSAFLTQWMSGTSAGPLEQGLLNYIQGQPPGTKANPTLELWMHNEYDQNSAGPFSAADWAAA